MQSKAYSSEIHGSHFSKNAVSNSSFVTSFTTSISLYPQMFKCNVIVKGCICFVVYTTKIDSHEIV